MSNVPLRDILIHARQESSRMRHFYLGVEHLFIALLEIRSGLTSSLMQDHGLTPDYVIDAVRRRTGKGARARLWAGMPNTPRADVVLGIAHDLALEAGRDEITERDLLLAILEERDSIPTRVLVQLGLDLDQLMQEANRRQLDSGITTAYLDIVFGPDYDTSAPLSEDALFILRRMFHGYNRIRVERRLNGGYSSALLVIVTPITVDNLEEAPVVVKIDRADAILDEAKRYEQHVRTTLPPLTARIEDRPTAPETSAHAGLKYTFVTDRDSGPRDLRSVAASWSGEKLGRWLQEQLYPYFGQTWWSQRRPYRFEAWKEYDWLLPPLLTLEMTPVKSLPPGAVVIREPLRRARINQIDYGELVAVENFTVHKIYEDRREIALTHGRGSSADKQAYQINVKMAEMEEPVYRGETIDLIAGKVYKTRVETLQLATRALSPNFDVTAPTIPGPAGMERLPNPLLHYDGLLDITLNGSVSKIHGDLHMGNILVGPNENPFLVDFAHTRDGHTLSDWAMLEVSLLSEVIMPIAGESWAAAYGALEGVVTLNARLPRPDGLYRNKLDKAFDALACLREIVAECLQTPGGWIEYYVPLAFCALRAMTWETMPLGPRRLMFLLAALSIHETRQTGKPGSSETHADHSLSDSGGSPTP